MTEALAHSRYPGSKVGWKEAGVGRVLSASVGSSSYNLQNQKEDRDSSGIWTGRMFAVQGRLEKDVTLPGAGSLLDTV